MSCQSFPQGLNNLSRRSISRNQWVAYFRPPISDLADCIRAPSARPNHQPQLFAAVHASSPRGALFPPQPWIGHMVGKRILVAAWQNRSEWITAERVTNVTDNSWPFHPSISRPSSSAGRDCPSSNFAWHFATGRSLHRSASGSHAVESPRPVSAILPHDLLETKRCGTALTLWQEAGRNFSQISCRRTIHDEKRFISKSLFQKHEPSTFRH